MSTKDRGECAESTEGGSDSDGRKNADGSDGRNADGSDGGGSNGRSDVDSNNGHTATIDDALRHSEWTSIDCSPASGRASGDEDAVADEASSDYRGKRLYDWWSRRTRLYDAVIGMATPLREEAFEALAADAGETVLDLGCGPGTNFERLRDGVGSEGTVIGLDYSPEMARQAAMQVAKREWSNVYVVRADATRTCGPPETFDAAFTTFALHTMEDVDAVVENVHETLRPGGRFVVSDARAIQDWPASALNPIYERVIAWTVNHQSEQDPLGALESTFESVAVVNTYDAGSGYLAVARKGE